jgi:hypothetical protein
MLLSKKYDQRKRLSQTKRPKPAKIGLLSKKERS